MTKGILKYFQSKLELSLQESFINEASMGGINRAAPAQDVSYEKVLNSITDKWKGQKVQVNELSGGKETDWAKKSAEWRSKQPMDFKDPKATAKAERRAGKEMVIKNKNTPVTNEQQLNELSPGKEKDVAAALNKYRSGVKPEEYYNDPKVQKKVDRRAERSMNIANKHSTQSANESKLNELSKGKYDSVQTALNDPKRAQKAKDNYQYAKDPEASARAKKLSAKKDAKGVFQPAKTDVVAESYEKRLAVMVEEGWKSKLAGT